MVTTYDTPPPVPQSMAIPRTLSATTPPCVTTGAQRVREVSATVPPPATGSHA